jgi:hypothetical protein
VGIAPNKRQLQQVKQNGGFEIVRHLHNNNNNNNVFKWTERVLNW